MAYNCKNNSELLAIPDQTPLKSYIQTNLEILKNTVSKMDTTDLVEARKQFKAARQALKTIEPFLVYITPKKMVGVNGPPLPVFREDNNKVLPPIGFQAIEEQLFSDEPLDTAAYLKKVYILQGYLKGISSIVNDATLGPRHLFIPIHQQLFSIFSLGIISFDTPITQNGTQESIIALNSIKEVYNITIKDSIRAKNPSLDKQFLSDLKNAVSYLKTNTNFETFDRYTFTRDYINPLTKDWVDIRKTSGIFDAPKKLAINMDAVTFFEKNSFNADYFLKTKDAPSDELVELGKHLFFDNKLSAKGTMSCATCHNPEKTYQDGLKVAKGNNGQDLLRNTPTIINSVFQRKFFWDGRSDDLVQQINLVFENEDEFNRNSAHVFSLEALDTLKYGDLVLQSFPDTKKLTKKTISRAISAYVSRLNAFNSKFDKNMRGETNDFTDEEKLGMNIFMGKGLCATCHFLPLTSGTVPPNLKETEKEVIGTPKTSKNKEIDTDEGFYWVYQADIHKYMFKTPSIRNIEHTAPYMHNGVYNTLQEVMDFYNKGGGVGMGFDLEHQTLPFDNLNLSNKEINAVIAFMKTLSDTEIDTSYLD